MSTALVVSIVTAGLVVAAVVSLIDAHRRGFKKGRKAQRARMFRLYRLDRVACEYELVTGRPIESVRRKIQPRRIGR